MYANAHRAVAAPWLASKIPRRHATPHTGTKAAINATSADAWTAGLPPARSRRRCVTACAANIRIGLAARSSSREPSPGRSATSTVPQADRMPVDQHEPCHLDAARPQFEARAVLLHEPCGGQVIEPLGRQRSREERKAQRGRRDPFRVSAEQLQK